MAGGKGAPELTNPGKRITQFNDDFRPLVERIKWRRLHLANDPSVSPELLEPLAHIDYQTTMLSKTWARLKARISENHGIVRATPDDNAAGGEKAAERLEAVLNAGWQTIEERNGYMLQDALADGQIADCYGVLHWRRCGEIYPAVPEYEYVDELPEDEGQRKRYQPDAEEEGENAGKYKETDASLQQRTQKKRAHAGFPYHMEVLDAEGFRFIADEAGGIAMALWLREVASQDYEDALDERGRKIVLEQRKYRVYMTKDLPRSNSGSPSANKHKTVTVATLWTRDAWYEYVAPTGGGDESKWELVESARHAWGRPPFALATALRFNHPDLVWRYQPYLEDAYKLKPGYDRTMALMIGLSERVALPDVFLTKTSSAAPGLGPDGKPLDATPDTASATQLPDGYDIKALTLQLAPAFIEGVRFQNDQMKEALPDTGMAEISASTQPWSARVAQQQAMVIPKRAIQQQSGAFLTGWRSIARDMATPVEEGGLGATIAVYQRGDEGDVTGAIVAIEPDEVRTLNLSIDINPVSSVDQITKMQHGVDLLSNPLVKLPWLKFAEEYANWPNPQQQSADYDAQQIVDQYLKPGLIAQKVGEQYGTRVVLGVNGEFVGMGGQQVPVDRALGNAGIKRMRPQRASGPMQGAMPPSGGFPALQDNATPQGVMPQPAMPGVQ